MSVPTHRIVAVGSPTSSVETAAAVGFLRALHLRVDTLVTYVGRLPIDGSPPLTEWSRGSFVVDDLRSWPAALRVEAVLGPQMAGRLRGLRLRVWLARLDPTVVILLDGDGDLHSRVVGGRNVRVLRLDRAVEAADQQDEFRVRWHGEGISLPPAIDGSHARGAATVDSLGECRSRLSMGAADLVVGVVCARRDTMWGDSVAAALAGSDRFVRVLRFEDRSTSTEVDGWRLSEADAELLGRLAACEIVVVLGADGPWRSQIGIWATFAGCRVVTGAHPDDLPEVTRLLTDCDDADRAEMIAAAKRRWDVASVADRFVADMLVGGGQ